MSRWVIPERPNTVAEQGEPHDGALARIVKYVPAEIVTTYTMLFAALVTLDQGSQDKKIYATALITLFFFVTIAYIWRETTGTVRCAHVIVSPLSFLAWAYPVSSALLSNWFMPGASFFLQAGVLGLAVFIKPRERS